MTKTHKTCLATDELVEFNSATLQYVHGLAAGDLPMVGDLAMLVARLARKLRKPARRFWRVRVDRRANRRGFIASGLSAELAVHTREQRGVFVTKTFVSGSLRRIVRARQVGAAGDLVVDRLDREHMTRHSDLASPLCTANANVTGPAPKGNEK